MTKIMSILLLLILTITAQESTKINDLETMLQHLQKQMEVLENAQKQEVAKHKREKELLKERIATLEKERYEIQERLLQFMAEIKAEKAKAKENLEENGFEEMLRLCWNGEYFDFTLPQWTGLSYEKQMKYAKRFQEWYAQKKKLEITKTIEKEGVTFEFKLIPPGKYWMGSPKWEDERDEDEKRHKVLISRAFWVGETEVTQKQWEAVMKENPAKYKGEKKPVEQISWEESKKFCEATGFSMLTEAQWEYVCRGGTTTKYNLGDDVAQELFNTGLETVATGSLSNANSWGCYDFHGNVWEWCLDGYNEDYSQEETDPLVLNGKVRVVRGGGLLNNICHSGARDKSVEVLKSRRIGLRISWGNTFHRKNIESRVDEDFVWDNFLYINWNGEYFDFTLENWENLAHEKQVEYARKYQEWYALENGLEVTKTIEKGGVKFVFKLIPPGKFWMGQEASGNEKRHRVLISETFYVGETEVTQEQWQAIMGNNPAYFGDAQNPVEQVLWNDCKSFCEKSEFSMLTEAQWEYACRGGTTAIYNLGSNISKDQVNYSSSATVQVKSLENENSWGCYDFHGNVWEWCADWYDGDYYKDEQTDPLGPNKGADRVLRGGSWNSVAEGCRSAYREGDNPSYGYNYDGFRCSVQLK